MCALQHTNLSLIIFQKQPLTLNVLTDDMIYTTENRSWCECTWCRSECQRESSGWLTETKVRSSFPAKATLFFFFFLRETAELLLFSREMSDGCNNSKWILRIILVSLRGRNRIESWWRYVLILSRYGLTILVCAGMRNVKRLCFYTRKMKWRLHVNVNDKRLVIIQIHRWCKMFVFKLLQMRTDVSVYA